MPIPAPIVDHVDQALDRKIEHFSGSKPVLDAIAFSFIDQLQKLEDEIWRVIYGRLLDPAPGQTVGARGAQLDTIGKIVGCKRQGYDDDTYVKAIKLQVLINRSKGRWDDLLKITRAAIGVSGIITDYHGEWHHVAYFRFDHIDPQTVLVLIRSLQRARPAGYRAVVEYYVTDVSPSDLMLSAWTDSLGNPVSGVTGQNGFVWGDADGNTIGTDQGFLTAMQG